MGGFTGVGQILNHFIPILPIGAASILLNRQMTITSMHRHSRPMDSWWILYFKSRAISSVPGRGAEPPCPPAGKDV